MKLNVLQWSTSGIENQGYIWQLQVAQTYGKHIINRLNIKTNGPTTILIKFSSKPGP